MYQDLETVDSGSHDLSRLLVCPDIFQYMLHKVSLWVYETSDNQIQNNSKKRLVNNAKYRAR